jgi:hypothetical protein
MGDRLKSLPESDKCDEKMKWTAEVIENDENLREKRDWKRVDRDWKYDIVSHSKRKWWKLSWKARSGTSLWILEMKLCDKIKTKIMKTVVKNETFTTWNVYTEIENKTLWQIWNENYENCREKARYLVLGICIRRLKIKHCDKFWNKNDEKTSKKKRNIYSLKCVIGDWK